MEVIDKFKSYLDRIKVRNKTTVKNYVSDVRHFLNWYHKSSNLVFEPSQMNVELIKKFETSQGVSLNPENASEEDRMSQASLKRHLSSLRRFTQFLKEDGYISENPFEKIAEEKEASKEIDIWHIQEFKDYLRSKGSSNLTVKNYITDTHSFKRWYENYVEPVVGKKSFPLINDQVVNEYKNTLIESGSSSPRTINRRLSSLRKYLEFAIAASLINTEEFYTAPVIPNIPLYQNSPSNQEKYSLNDVEDRKVNLNYSSIPPIRLFQTLIILPYLLAESFIAGKLLSIIYGAKPVAEAAKKVSPKTLSNIPMPTKPSDLLGVKGYKKEHFAPNEVSTDHYPIHKKIWHHSRHTRPKWYKRYHNNPIVHYIHFAVMIIFAAGAGIALYNGLIAEPSMSSNSLLAKSSPSANRTLSFQGRLTNNSNNPIETPKSLRFGIYNDISASGSALLWQETHYNASPDNTGLFKVILGNKNSIPESVFTQNEQIYLGVSVENTSELRPRRRIAPTSYAGNSENLQGMLPITDPSADNSNVILALDSSGNLNIGEDADPNFTASGGQFSLSGDVLMLTTVTGTNSDVVISPDGLGQVDVQKGLVNNTGSGILSPGAVEVADKFSVTATESAVASFMVNNNGGSDLFTASSSGRSRFTVKNDGSLLIPTYSNSGGILYSNGAGDIRQTGTGTFGQCLKSIGGTSPSWGNCDSGAFEENNGIIAPKDINTEFLLGSTSTSSARFRVFNVSGASTPVASISAITTAKALSLSGDGSIQTARNNNLTLGGNKTGNILLMPQDEKGRVGVNIKQPNATFDIKSTNGTIPGTRITSNTIQEALRVINNGDGNLISASASGDTKFEVRNNGDVVADGTITGSGSDFAEYFKKANPKEKFESGQLVCIAENGVTKCTETNNNILGAVSDNAGFIGGGNRKDDSNYVLVGLVGQIEVRTEGDINPGDPLTASTKPGIAKKATNEGFIVGYAMEKGRNSRVLSSIKSGYYAPHASLNIWGDKSKEFASKLNINKENGSWTITNLLGEPIKRAGDFSEIISANIRAGLVNAQKISTTSFEAAKGNISNLTSNIINASNATIKNLSATTANIASASVNSLSIGSENVLIAGTSLRDYVAGIVTDTLDTRYSILANENEIVSPLVSAENINTNAISPLSNDSIEITSNASVSGDLASDTITSNEATISGNIASNSLETNSATISGDLAARNATVSGSLASDTLNTRDASISGSLALSDEALNKLNEDLNRTRSSSIAADSQISGSESTQLALNDLNYENESTSSPSTDYELPTTIDEIDTGNLYADLGLFSEGLNVLGPTTTNQLTAMDGIAIGTGFIMQENSLNTLGETLEIQPLRQADISFMAGKVKIDTDGNVDIGGNLNLAGDIKASQGLFDGIETNSLATNIISPLPNSNLIVRLGGNGSSESGNMTFEDSNGQEIARIANNGDIVSSGSATFDKLNFNLVGEALAETTTTATSTGSAGFATLKRNQREITIYNDNVTKDSLIYITPFGDTEDKILHLLRQTPHEKGENGTQGSFTVGVSGIPASKDIEFNWLIVN